LSCFWPFLVSLHKELKNAIQKKVYRCPGRYVAFFFLKRPCSKKGKRSPEISQSPGPRAWAQGTGTKQTADKQRTTSGVHREHIRNTPRAEGRAVYGISRGRRFFSFWRPPWWVGGSEAKNGPGPNMYFSIF
jgi:hypothetical protein